MRLIDADALIEIFDKDEYERVRNEYESGYNDGLLHAEVVADDLPTIDAVPVIRCKDCKYAIERYITNLPWLAQWEYSCRYHNTLSLMGNDYCSRAERKEE